MNIMRQSACLVINITTVYSYGLLFSRKTVGQASSLAIVLLRKRELVALLIWCVGCLRSRSFPRVTMDWCAVCDCGISWSYSLTHLQTYRGFLLLNKDFFNLTVGKMRLVLQELWSLVPAVTLILTYKCFNHYLEFISPVDFW